MPGRAVEAPTFGVSVLGLRTLDVTGGCHDGDVRPPLLALGDPHGPPALPSRVLLGGYTSGGRPGLELLTPASAGRSPSTKRTTARLTDPSWLASASPGIVLAVQETSPSALVAVRVADEGEPALALGSPLTLSGSGACHAAITGADARGVRHAVVAHYGSGSISVVRLGPAGEPLEETDHLVLTGSGPVPERQEAPHAHQAFVRRTPGAGPREAAPEEVWVCDLGTDRVHRFAIGAAGLLHHAAEPITLPPGFGPRHLGLHAANGTEHVVVAGELSATIWLGHIGGDGSVCTLGEVPASGCGASQPSGLRVADGLVWCANRGIDTVSAHRIEVSPDAPGAARLVPVAEVATGAAWPRDLVVTPTHVWVAGERGNVVTVLDRSALLHGGTGGAALPETAVTRLATPAPTAIVIEA